MSPVKILKTGKYNVLSSVNSYLQTHLSGYATVVFGMPQAALPLPAISVNEVGLFNDLGGGYDEGFRRQQTILEIKLWADETQDAGATRTVIQLRDRLMYALMNAGRTTASGLVMPAIPIYDHAAGDLSTVQGYVRIPWGKTSTTSERLDTAADNPRLKVYRILQRVEWHESLD